MTEKTGAATTEKTVSVEVRLSPIVAELLAVLDRDVAHLHPRFTTRSVAPPMLGIKTLPFEVMHTGEFWVDMIKSGRIKIARKIKEPVTMQDPCNIIRRGGAAEKFRYFVNETCEDFREMTPNREHNFCCNAGGGLAGLSNWAAHKAKGNRVKAEQIKETGAKIVITPCHNCSTGIKDVIKYWDLGVKNVFFDEILVQTMELHETLKAGK